MVLGPRHEKKWRVGGCWCGVIVTSKLENLDFEIFFLSKDRFQAQKEGLLRDNLDLKFLEHDPTVKPPF
jgi:hypothetical protein